MNNEPLTSYPITDDGYVTITVAEYDRLIALAKVTEAEADIVSGNISPIFDNVKDAMFYLNKDED